MRIGVVGGGIQGVGVALELSLRGHSVELFEKADACLTQASLQNEGKVHLGFLYANDPAPLATARLLAEAAHRFEPIVRRWLEKDFDDWAVSSPFHCAVHRDSLLSPGKIAAYLAAVSDVVAAVAQKPGSSYFGIDSAAAVRKLPPAELRDIVNEDLVCAVFEAPEIAIDPEPLALALRNRVAEEQRILVHFCTRVHSITPGESGVLVTGEGPCGRLTETYDHVVNAAWEERLAIDATANVLPEGPWSFRLKCFLRIPPGATRRRIPCATIVLGGFGDIVQYGNGGIFLAWYPVARQGLSSALLPPAWPLPLPEPKATHLRSETHRALSRIFPAVNGLSPADLSAAEVRGGIIYARGNTDVDDPASDLHQRHKVGPRSFGRYHSIDTGRYTFAPLFAER